MQASLLIAPVWNRNTILDTRTFEQMFAFNRTSLESKLSTHAHQTCCN